MAGKSLSERIGDLGHRLAVEAHAAWLAARDPRVPWFARILAVAVAAYALSPIDLIRSEEHTSELQSLMRISYAVFCLKKKKILPRRDNTRHEHMKYHMN